MDFNAIENAWKLLRDRLDDTQPTEVESRDAFIARRKQGSQEPQTKKQARAFTSVAIVAQAVSSHSLLP